MNLNLNTKKTEGHDKGFTLLELLIVVSIIAILSVALVVILDPAEALKKSRDAQRISDMNTMKTAIGLYLTSTTTPYLGGSSNATCRDAASSTPQAWTNNDRIYYSTNGVTITDLTLDTFTFTAPGGAATSTTPSVTDGTGWIPVNFDSLLGGSPISNIPLDPVNTIGAPSAVVDADLVYRYACLLTPLTFEMDATLESTAYASGSDNKMTSDGGNSSVHYEVGTNLKILGAGGASPAGF